MSNILIFIITGFWFWMLVDCYQNESNRGWLSIVLFLYFPGALMYFMWRDPKSQPRKIISPLRRLQLQQELLRAKIAVKSIGKAYQYLILGNILLEFGDFPQAELAYSKALSKEPKNPYALWGAALVSFQQDRFAVAARHLELLLKIDPKHLQGDASLLYVKVLFNLEKWSVARSYLQDDIYYWGHPESIIMLAKIERQDRNISKAKELLQDLVCKLNNSPKYHLRRHHQIIKEAQYMLRTMPSISYTPDYRGSK
ncbi:MAG: hypothetical protein RLZZ135_44 [Cyanobacteriota bacterium]